MDQAPEQDGQGRYDRVAADICPAASRGIWSTQPLDRQSARPIRRQRSQRLGPVCDLGCGPGHVAHLMMMTWLCGPGKQGSSLAGA